MTAPGRSVLAIIDQGTHMSGNKHFCHAWQVVVIACLIAWIGKKIGQTTQVTPNAANSTDWDRNFINSGGTTDSPPVRFEFTYVFSRQGHLIGEFHIDNGSDAAVQV